MMVHIPVTPALMLELRQEHCWVFLAASSTLGSIRELDSRKQDRGKEDEKRDSLLDLLMHVPIHTSAHTGSKTWTTHTQKHTYIQNK